MPTTSLVSKHNYAAGLADAVLDGPSYYVSKSGNDSTGTGSKLQPWLTIHKALTTAPAGGGYNIRVGSGTYAEDSGGAKFLFITRTFTSMVTVRPWRSWDVVKVTDAASGTFCVDFWGCTNVRFQDLTIEQAGANSVGTVYGGNAATGVELVNCTITTRNQCLNVTNWSVSAIGCTMIKRTGEVGIIQGLLAGAGATDTTLVNFSNCTITGQGVSAAVYGALSNVAGALTVTLTNCNVTAGTGYGVNVHGGTLRLYNCTVNATSNAAVIFGTDGTNTYTTAGLVSGGVISSTSSHALLVGQGSSAVTVTSTTVNAGDHGIVIKGTNIIVDGCTVNPGTMAGVLLKGCSAPIVRNSLIQAAVGGQGCVILTNEGATKPANITLTNNRIMAGGLAACLLWPDGSGDGGGGVCDYNAYASASGLLGTVRSTSGITTLAGLQAAWSGYGVSGNDSHSSVAVM